MKFKFLFVVLVCCITIGCATPSYQDSGAKLTLVAAKEKLDEIRLVDARSTVSAADRASQKQEIAGEMIDESRFEPSAFEYLRATIAESEIRQKLLRRDVKVLQLDVVVQGDKRYGEGASSAQWAASTAAGPFGPLGMALFDGIKRVATAESTTMVKVYLIVELNGKQERLYGAAILRDTLSKFAGNLDESVRNAFDDAIRRGEWKID
jgi:hypothetical protein